MSKNKGSNGGFQNRAAQRFKNPNKVDLISQKEIFSILDQDMLTMLDQVTDHRNKAGKYPDYIVNMFGNLSTSLYFYNFIKDHCKVTKKGKLKTDLSDDAIISLKQILADAYKKSATNYFSEMTIDFKDRADLLSKAFIILDVKNYKLTKKLGIKKSQRRDVCIQVFGDPVYNIKFLHKIINYSSLDDKKKLKLLKKMYGGHRFVKAVGAAMTVDSNNSDCITMLVEYVKNMKKRKNRAPYIMAYADAFKVNKTYNFRLADGEFYKKNKPIIRELIDDVDIGYKKAFKPLKPKNIGKKQKKPKDKDKEFKVKTTVAK